MKTLLKTVEIDRGKALKEQPHTGHNRWHPNIAPIIEVGEGEEVGLQTRDAFDGQFTPKTTVADFSKIDPNLIHPLTGPVYVKGAKAGDVLEIEFVDINPEKWAFTAIFPGLGFLRDICTTPYFVHWNIADNFATSPQLPGVRVPGASFMGVSGLAPSSKELQVYARREAELAERGGLVFLQDTGGAVPAEGVAAREGLRTVPPRECGGNFDIKQLTRGSKLFLPVSVDGALFSSGDAHFAQGDGEVCVTAIEMAATVVVRFKIRKGGATRMPRPRFAHSDYFADPRFAVPRKFTATIGMPIRENGRNEGEDLTLACRNAVLDMIGLLQERGWSREQAYAICSVAVDLRISNVVDVPNYVVSALLPEDIFER
jgi:formamidase